MEVCVGGGVIIFPPDGHAVEDLSYRRPMGIVLGD